jgi:RHS repeat-associated protein
VVSRSSRGLTGEWQNPTGLVFLRARFYSPELGIFLSRDPFQGFLTKPASLTPYQYAFNNPVRYTDPSGENPLLLVGLLGGLLGGAIYGYGSQVVRNYNSGDFNNCPWWAIFTTNISAGQIALYAGAGALLGLGIGGMIVGAQWLAGYIGFGAAAGTEATQGFNNLSQAARYGIQQANQLRSAISGTGLQVHHIIEQRLAPALGQSAAQARQWLSVAVTPEEHQLFTNQWRNAIGYINSTNTINTITATVDDIWLAAQVIYADHPALLDAARIIIFGN